MKTHIIQIGNSQGIRIPKLLLEQSGLSGEVELQARNQSLIIRPIHQPRHDWAEKFRRMAENDDDRLLDDDHLTAQNRWDEEEWVW